MSNKDRVLGVLSLLPLYFTWLLGLSFSEHPLVQRQARQGAVLSLGFLAVIFGVGFLNRLPWVGDYFLFVTPFFAWVAAIIYVATSLFLIFALLRNRPFEIKVMQPISQRIYPL